MTERRVGLPRPRDVKAADQLQKKWDTAGIQALPLPYAPGRITGAGFGAKGATTQMIFQGDTGGIEDPTYQKYVALALAAEDKAELVYTLGDQVYFNCDPALWMNQFYQPYAHDPKPYVGVPGNHDGDPTDGVPGAGIASWMANMCTKTPQRPLSDPQDEFGRDTQTLPSHDWTADLGYTTIIGLYSNVISGGHLFQNQIDWLTGELQAAPKGVPLLVCMHHPAYSVDAYHGGSALMGSILDQAFATAGRLPTAVLAGHVHDYQRFTRSNGVAYIVSGNGGYHNLHGFAGDATPGLVLGDVTFEAGDDKNWGFLSLTADGPHLQGEYVQVDSSGSVTHGADTFTL